MKELISTYLSYMKAAIISMACAVFIFFIAAGVRNLIVIQLGYSGIGVSSFAIIFAALTFVITIPLIFWSQIRKLIGYFGLSENILIEKISNRNKGDRNHGGDGFSNLRIPTFHAFEVIIQRIALFLLLLTEMVRLLYTSIEMVLRGKM